MKDLPVVFFPIFVIWLLFSPSLTMPYIILAIGVSFFASLIFIMCLSKKVSHKMLESTTFHFLMKRDFYRYLKFLIKEGISSSLHVLHSAITHKEFTDEIIEIVLPMDVSSHKILLIIYSVTLTPGTSVVGVQNNKILVHCLTKSIKNSLEEMTFINKVLSFNF